MNTGLNRRTLKPAIADHGNAEGSNEANSFGPVETQRSAGYQVGGHSEHRDDAKTPRIPDGLLKAGATGR